MSRKAYDESDDTEQRARTERLAAAVRVSGASTEAERKRRQTRISGAKRQLPRFLHSRNTVEM